jgi:hypothetical protein
MSVMDYRKYIKRINLKIGEIRAADKIEEVSWSNTVVNELNQMSIECANELQTETRTAFRKPPREGVPEGYILNLFEAPPSRILALEILMAAWLGWVTHEKEGEKVPPQFTAEGCRRLIDEAYMYGVNLSSRGDKLDD